MIDSHLTEAEWQEVGERGFEKFTPAQRWIATGQLVEVATPEEVAMMFGQLLALADEVPEQLRYPEYLATRRSCQWISE